MAEYIKRDEFIAWLKRIPLKDLSEGRGLCRIIMEEDFKRAIKKLPREVIADVAPVVRCKDCKFYPNHALRDIVFDKDACHWHPDEQPDPDDFCSCGERKNDGA